MSSDSETMFDELSPASTGGEESDAEWYEFEAGDTVIGEIRRVNMDAGDYGSGVLEVSRGPGDTICFWMNRTVKTAVSENDLGPGDVVGIQKSADEATYTDDDGEEQTYYPFEVRVQR